MGSNPIHRANLSQSEMNLPSQNLGQHCSFGGNRVESQIPHTIIGTNLGFSIARVLNGVAYLSGIVCREAIDKYTHLSFGDQFHKMLATLDARLSLVKSDKSKLLEVTVHLASMEYYDSMSQIWQQWLGSTSPPARTTVEAKLLGNCLAEITVITASDIR